MASVQEIYNCIDSKFPYCLQMNYDNSGIMVDCGKEITKVLVSLDITNSLIDYAASSGCELIVSHHPVIFNPIKSLSHNTPVYKLITNRISAISAHTNFDIAEGGVSDQLASRLDLQNIKPVFKASECEIKGKMYQNHIGRMGETIKEFTPSDFAAYVGEKLGRMSYVEYVDGGNPIKKVAVGGGACGEFIFECKKYNIDAFVTGEAKHHELVYAAENKITMIAAGHYITECVALEELAQTIRDEFNELSVEVTRIDNPISFFQVRR